MPRLAIVLKGYPRLSETFIAQEILNLERAGFDLILYSLRHPTDEQRHPVHGEVRAPVVYLPEYLYREPWRVLRAWIGSRNLPGFKDARKRFLADLRRDPTPNRIRRFGQALVLANELPPDMPALYAHFLHTPASVARYAAVMRHLPWACSAHAKDIYTTPEWEIREKLEECEWLTTCTAENVHHLTRLSGNHETVTLNYHGLDLDRFAGGVPVASRNNGGDADRPVRLLSIGRAVEKKGYDDLLQALAMLPGGLNWRLRHVGGGPLLETLAQRARKLKLEDRIDWLGPLPQEEVLSEYRAADLFVLNSRVDRHGDRDGLPNVIVEAQSQGLAVVSTRLSGIPELIEHRTNGLLVEPGETAALAAAMARLITDPALRHRMGEAGRGKVHQCFEMRAAFVPLAEKLGRLGESQASSVRSTNQ